ncbi:MAG: acyl-CoA/acyl-ACP dehydrogenase [Halieaceae bacterium]|nr:acyl-CoA/acyl-ACP dehydrogenase [Halieaceae bacterium]
MSGQNHETEAFRQNIADVLGRECDSLTLHGFVDGKNDLAQQLWEQVGELGWLALGLPEQYGGLDLGVAGLGMLHAELGSRLAPGPYIATLCAAQWLLAHAEENHKLDYLPLIAAGDLSVAVPATPTRRAGGLVMSDGELTGSEAFLLGDVSAGLAIAPFRGTDGSDAWAIIAVDGNSASLKKEAIWDVTRQICRLDCNGAPVAGVITELRQASTSLARHLGIALACDSIGGAETILDQTVVFLKERIQFDRPLASFQALKHRIVNHKAELETSRHLLAQALDCAADDQPDALMWSALAKATASSSYASIAGDCLQLHGGVGYTWEFDCHLHLKRAQLNCAMGDSNEVNLDTAARELARSMRDGRSTLELPL